MKHCQMSKQALSRQSASQIFITSRSRVVIAAYRCLPRLTSLTQPCLVRAIPSHWRPSTWPLSSTRPPKSPPCTQPPPLFHFLTVAAAPLPWLNGGRRPKKPNCGWNGKFGMSSELPPALFHQASTSLVSTTPFVHFLQLCLLFVVHCINHTSKVLDMLLCCLFGFRISSFSSSCFAYV
ncbi:hypothetical protein NL676_010823, partial [Syzygium grande]